MMKLEFFLRIDGVGARLQLERIDVEICPGSKPRTTLCWLMSVEVLASDPVALRSSLPRTVANVEVDSSGAQRRAVKGGESDGWAAAGASRKACTPVVCGASCGGSGDNGSMTFFSCIELTTFSRSIGVMCLPRAVLAVESWRRSSGRDDEESERCWLVVRGSIESSDATLVDNSGTSGAAPGAICWLNDHCGGTTWSGWQQNVSRAHSRQAMFS